MFEAASNYLMVWPLIASQTLRRAPCGGLSQEIFPWYHRSSELHVYVVSLRHRAGKVNVVSSTYLAEYVHHAAGLTAIQTLHFLPPPHPPPTRLFISSNINNDNNNNENKTCAHILLVRPICHLLEVGRPAGWSARQERPLGVSLADGHSNDNSITLTCCCLLLV